MRRKTLAMEMKRLAINHLTFSAFTCGVNAGADHPAGPGPRPNSRVRSATENRNLNPQGKAYPQGPYGIDVLALLLLGPSGQMRGE